MSTDINTLLDMGFQENRARRALAKSGYKGAQVAMDWIFAHENDPDLDDPWEEPAGQVLGGPNSAPATSEPNQEETTTEPGDGTSGQAAAQAKSLRCDDCGKVFRNMDEAEFHAAKTEHANFSESTEEKRVLTAEEKQEQLKKLQERMQLRRLEREQKEKQDALSKEKQRRVHGKDMVAAKQKIEELEMQKIIEQRRREKEDDRLARQKIKDEIERDRRDRAAKTGGASGAATTVTAAVPAGSPNTDVKKTTSTTNAAETKLQIRLTNGESITQTFGSKEQLAAVRLYVQINRTDGNAPFKMMTTFPRRVFTDEDMDKPLSELGLVPSAVIVISKV